MKRREYLQTRCVHSVIDAWNTRGFVIEGRKRACVWSIDRWQDMLLMGILRDEWIERISILEQ